MKEVFADTHYFLALFNVADTMHRRAVEFSVQAEGRLVTTAWVLTEVADALADPANRRGCTALIETVLRNPEIRMVPPDEETFMKGWMLYRSRQDKGGSLTDCISFLVMKERHIKEALTGDRHFEQAGFTALLK